MTESAADDTDYGADAIQVLKGLRASVRTSDVYR